MKESRKRDRVKARSDLRRVLTRLGILATIAGLTAVVAKRLHRLLVSEEAVNEVDRDILVVLHRANAFEIEIGRLAEQQGSTAATSRLGRVLVGNHDLLQGYVAQAAARFHVDLHESNDSRQARESQLEQLGHLPGSEFDRAFISCEINGHLKTIRAVREAIQHGENPSVRVLLGTMLSTLTLHLEQARSMRSEMSASPS